MDITQDQTGQTPVATPTDQPATGTDQTGQTPTDTPPVKPVVGEEPVINPSQPTVEVPTTEIPAPKTEEPEKPGDTTPPATV